MRTPRETVEAWVKSFNDGDATALGRLYEENATNHQVMWDPAVGRDAIESIFRREFEQAEMVCLVENIFEDGDWAILEWRDPKGLRGCGFFQVFGGLIRFQRGYWDQLTFARQQGLPIPD